MNKFSFSSPHRRNPTTQRIRQWIPPVVLLFVIVSAVGIVMKPSAFILDVRTRLISLVRPNPPRTDIQQLQQELAAITEENTRLRDLLTLQESATQHQWSIVPARVSGINSLPTSPLIILDRGSSDGVSLGMPVLANGDIIIGTIAAVTSRTSSVLPLTHPNSRIAATVQNSQRTIGVLQGSANLSLELLLVPRSEPLREYQRIITSGSQPLIPRGLFIGEINTVENDLGNIFLEATVNPATDPDRVSTVGIITNSSPPQR